MSSKTKAAGKQDAQPALTPKLRFPEFRDALGWKEKRLGSLGKFLRGLTYGAPDVSETGLLVLRSTNIQNTNLVLDRDLVFVDKACADELLLLTNDIVICMSNGSKSLVGKSAEYKGDYQGDLTVGAFCSLFRPSNQFSKLAFQSEQYVKFVSISIGGGNINNLKNSDLENFGLPVPPAPAEQQKIAECLTTLDEVIAAQSQKLDALKTHKKGLMQQLFPREGETLPRLRFPEFQAAPEWEVRTIGDMFQLINGCAFKPEDWKTSGTPIIRIQNLNDPSAEFNYSQAPVPERNRIESGDLLFAWSGTLGSSFGARVWNGPSGVLNQHIFKVLMDEREITLQFSLLVLARVEEDIAKKTHGFKASFVHVKKSDLVKVELLLPSLPEQQRIASCLTTLDDLITAQSAKLSALKTHKKGLMQQLFPSREQPNTL